MSGRNDIHLSNGTLLAIGALSASIIAFQLALMQIFSITQWYHFAYMVISVAMLGFGAAGTFLTITQSRLPDDFERWFPTLCLLTGVGMATVVHAANSKWIQFDIFLFFNDPRHVARLLGTYLLIFLPFFTGALAIGLSFVRYAGQIGRLYFANLLGSGLGGLFAVWLMWQFLPWELPPLIAVLPLAAGIVFIPRRLAAYLGTLALATAGVIIFFTIHPRRLEISQYKDLSGAMLLPEAEIICEENSPQGLIQGVSAPALRHAPGLSLNYYEPTPVREVIFNNGDWMGPLFTLGSTSILDHTTDALPFVIRKPVKALILDGGTGERVAHAMAEGAQSAVLVEDHLLLLNLLKGQLAPLTDSLLWSPSLEVYRGNSRTFLLADTGRFDMILLPRLGAFGGTSGIDAMQEQYILTREAFQGMWQKLTPDGIIGLSCWIDYPPRHSLKALATLVEVLEMEGIRNPQAHLIAVRNWGMITFAVKKSPFTTKEREQARQFCDDMSFDPALLEDIRPGERMRYNQLDDTSYFTYLDTIMHGRREAFYGAYDFNVRPATDNRPFFSQFLKLKNLPSLGRDLGARRIPFLEVGYLIVWVTLVQMAIFAGIFILLPLSGKKFRQSVNSWTVIYFSGIGVGYMFVEIVLIQQFVLFFGSSIYATAAVISCLLIASGAGSLYSSKIRTPLWVVPLVIGVFILSYALLLPSVIRWLVDFPFAFKTLLLLLLVAPLGFAMGIPFPKGISYLTLANDKEIPWAWGLNGYFSVISTALATIVAVEAGFSWVLLCAAVGYFAVALRSVRK